MVSFCGNGRIFLVATAFVVLAAVIFPVAKTHPAEMVFALGTLHMITAAILFDTGMATWTILRVGTENEVFQRSEGGG